MSDPTWHSPAHAALTAQALLIAYDAEGLQAARDLWRTPLGHAVDVCRAAAAWAHAAVTGELAPSFAANRSLAEWDQLDRDQVWAAVLELGALLVAHRANEASPTWTAIPDRHAEAIADLVPVLRHDTDLSAVVEITPRTVVSIALVRGLQSLVDEHRSALEAAREAS